jgi:predicted nucleic acid-binding protein
MKYLLDVNALVALLVAEHSLNGRTVAWVRGLVRRKQANLLTCPITELGFVRILSQPSTFGRTIAEAQNILHRAKTGAIVSFDFIHDGVSVSALPAWVGKPGQVTDGHLAELAKANGAMFATLDAGIPRAFLIPA